MIIVCKKVNRMSNSKTVKLCKGNWTGVLLASDVDVQQASLCVVINQPVGNPKRKV
jgi:hypothetical protein